MSASSIRVIPALQMSAWKGDGMTRICFRPIAYHAVIRFILDGFAHHNFWSHPVRGEGDRRVQRQHLPGDQQNTMYVCIHNPLPLMPPEYSQIPPNTTVD